MKKYFAFTVIIGIFTAASYITGNAVGQDRKKPTPPQPATIGLVDVAYVFKHYKKAGDQQGQFEAKVKNKESEFKGLADQIKQVGNERKRFNSGTVEYQQKDDQLTSLQADLAAKARQADKAFATQQATMLRNLYGDVNAVIRSAARYYGLTLVLRVDPADPENPTSRTQVMKELNRQVLFHDASMNITKAVLNTLNKRYEQDVAGGSNGGSSNTKSRTATRRKNTRKRR
mgnify:FL=1